MANTDERSSPRIVIEADGPYHVHADIPLVRKTQIVSEYGEPLTWKPQGALKTNGVYELCRCGQSSDKPFCDGTHWGAGFDGTETADTGPTAARQITYEGSTGIVIKRDHSLCMEAGFCGTRLASIEKLAAETGDTNVRSQVIAMIERCPSGSLVYAMAEGESEIEPDLPPQIAVTTEITSGGPIAGPLWVTGNITIERADGQPFETRNRVTLCNCGESKNKPLCDGAHRALAAES